MAKKENALDLAKLIDKGVRVKLSGGREGDGPASKILKTCYPMIASADSWAVLGVASRYCCVDLDVSGLQWRAS